jgi:hypothetical protein
MERMSALDASFLEVEDGVTHMHIGSVGLFEGPLPLDCELRGMVLGKLALSKTTVIPGRMVQVGLDTGISGHLQRIRNGQTTFRPGFRPAKTGRMPYQTRVR